VYRLASVNQGLSREGKVGEDSKLVLLANRGRRGNLETGDSTEVRPFSAVLGRSLDGKNARSLQSRLETAGGDVWKWTDLGGTSFIKECDRRLRKPQSEYSGERTSVVHLMSRPQGKPEEGKEQRRRRAKGFFFVRAKRRGQSWDETGRFSLANRGRGKTGKGETLGNLEKGRQPLRGEGKLAARGKGANF